MPLPPLPPPRRAQALLFGVLLCANAQAETAPVEVVVTGTRTPESAQRASIHTDVVSAEEAKRRGATNVGEALASQPGVVVNPGAYSNLGGVSAIQVQGLDRERVLVLEDGERVIGDTGGAIDLSAMPVGDITRIEIVPGPMSSLYGSSAIGGVVNVMTGAPAFPGPSGQFRLEGRSHRGLFASASGAHRLERGWVGVDGSYFRADGVKRSEGRPELAVPSTERWLTGLRGGVSLNEAVDMRIRLRWIRQSAVGVESLSRPGAGTFFLDLPTTSDRYIALLATNHRLGQGHSLRLTASQQWFIGGSEKLYRGSKAREERSRRGAMQSVEAIATLADGPRTWVLGARAEVERYHQSLDKVVVAPGLVDTSHADEVPSILLGTVAGYGQIAWKLGKLTLLPGFRTELYRRYGTSLAPRLSAAYRPSGAVQLRASVGRGFRTPSAKEIGFVFDHSFYGYRVIGEPNLLPERSWGANADISFRPDPRIFLRVGGFANWIEDLIDLDLAAGKSQDGVAIYTYRNFSRARTAGGQIAGTYRIGERLRAELAYDHLYTHDDILGEPLPGRSPHIITASLFAEMPLRLSGYLRGRHHADAFVSREARTPAWISLDARIARPLWPSAEAYLGISNALDSKQTPGEIADMRPLQGRVIYLGLQAELPMMEDDG